MPQDALISIVDDDESLRAALVGLVRSLGYRARDFATAEGLLADNAAHDSACIVTDIQLPGLSGFDLQAQLAQQGSRTPLIMITARTEEGLRDRAVAGGAVCLLKKPFAAEALIACLERALASR